MSNLIMKTRRWAVNLKNKTPILLLLWNEFKRIQFKNEYKKVSNTEAVRKLYFKFCGRYPDIQKPTLFSEKLQYLKLKNHNPLLTQCVDKLAVRKFIELKGLNHILNDLLLKFNDTNNFDLESLPNKFVLKGAHGSGWNLICKDKYQINWFIWKFIFKSWLKQNIYYNGREWPYKNSEANIIVEKYLEDESGELRDYKFHCFHGEPMFIQVNAGRFSKEPVQNFYSLDWEVQEFGKDIASNPKVVIPKPETLDEMITIAKLLSADFEYVRVDLYEVKKKVIFGELTFYPASGLPDFKPERFDKVWGAMLNIQDYTDEPNEKD